MNRITTRECRYCIIVAGSKFRNSHHEIVRQDHLPASSGCPCVPAINTLVRMLYTNSHALLLNETPNGSHMIEGTLGLNRIRTIQSLCSILSMFQWTLFHKETK